MEYFSSRTEILIGHQATEKLKNSHVCIFGLGGVGGYVVEALVRSGISKITLIDNDKIHPSNLNRQIIATTKTLGQYKVDAFKKRIFEINPDVKVNIFKIFYTPDTKDEIDFSEFDYVVDAIDTISGKLQIIENAKKVGVKVISSMGAGNKLNPTDFIVSDISKTSVCPLARKMRNELKKRGIEDVKVVYSKEAPIKSSDKNKITGSISFVPSTVGLIIASEVVKDIIKS